MYTEYFGLKDNPFSIVPDPRFLYMSEGHREALAHLVYGINNDSGFILLTGEVGTGKTLVCRCLLEQIPDNCETAFILNPKVTVTELLATICDEFGIDYPKDTESVKVFVAKISDYLLQIHERGRRAILIIEEAQNLSVDVLEQIRLLTNLETSHQKLLQIIMVGQPELLDLLARPALRQLSQRITARYHLGPLSKKEIPTYVRHRLSVAGLVRGELFPSSTMDVLFRLTGGVPRLINLICDRALLGAFVQGKEKVDRKTLSTAAREVSGKKSNHSMGRRTILPWIAGGCLVLLLAAIVAGYNLHYRIKAPLSPSPETPSSRPATTNSAPGSANPTTAKPPDHTLVGTRDRAYEALFLLWNMTYDPGDSRTMCEQARSQGVRCMEGKDTLDTLRTINKPAVLRLVDTKGGEYYATLISLDGDIGTYSMAGEKRTGTTKEIVERWSGDYLLLWRAPQGWKEDLRPNKSEGPVVAWLDKQLGRIQKRKSAGGQKKSYDDDMVKQVREFQRKAGLTADGIVGPMTIIKIADVTGDGGPTLRNGKGSGT